MKMLLETFERYRPLFTEGKFKTFKPLYEATEGFFFSHNATTADLPHVRDALDLKRFMILVVAGLAPALLVGLHFFGLRVLAMIAVSYAVGGTIEVLFAMARREEINEGFLVTGLIFPLVLPPMLPLWMVGVGVAFGVIVGKELFGGTGRNLFNPALVGRCFLAIGYPAAMSASWIKPGEGTTGRFFEYVSTNMPDAITSATPLALAKQGSLADISHLFWGNTAGSVGETSAIAVILGGVLLVATRVANWRIVLGTLGSFAILNVILHAASPETFAPTVWNLFAGGLLFGAFFMATDPATSPVTNSGKWVYAAIIGVSTLLIRSMTGYVEGVMFAILLGNIAAPLIDEVAFRVRFRRLKNEG